jgi:hypothetical protein
MADYTLTLNLSEGERALLDEVRGEADMETFARTLLVEAALEAAPDFPIRSEDELTPADHIRLAAAAETNSVDIDELERLVWEDIRKHQAQRGAK